MNAYLWFWLCMGTLGLGFLLGILAGYSLRKP